jgi:hypothetical protein
MQSPTTTNSSTYSALLTVLTSKIRPSKPQVREEYTTSFMHIFYTNKVPRVVLQFLWTGTQLGGKWNQCATRARHGRTTRHDRPCRCGRPGRCGGPCRCGRTCPVPRPQSQTLPSLRAQLGWMRLIKETSVSSNGWSCDHLDQWVHLSGRSTATTLIPRPSWVSPSEGSSSHGLEAGLPHLEGRPHLPTAIPAKTNARNRPSTASGARIRSVQVKRRWIIGPAAPLDRAAPMKMGPHAQPTSLAYKKSLTPAGFNTPRWSISFPRFCSLRIGLV